MKQQYDVTYFIKKFEAIPEEDWIINQQQDKRGRRCAYGHCMPVGYKPLGEDYWVGGRLPGHETPEGKSLLPITISITM